MVGGGDSLLSTSLLQRASKQEEAGEGDGERNSHCCAGGHMAQITQLTTEGAPSHPPHLLIPKSKLEPSRHCCLCFLSTATTT